MTQQELINQGYVLKETIKCSGEKTEWNKWIENAKSLTPEQLLEEEDPTKDYYYGEVYIYEKPKK